MGEQVEIFEISLAEQIAEVERELVMRRMLYPLWVANKRMSKRTAERQMNRLLAVLATLHHAAVVQ